VTPRAWVATRGVAGVLAAAVAVSGVVGTSAAAAVEPPASPPIEAEPPASWPRPEGLELLAAYLLVEADTGQVLVARRAEERRPVASTIKVLAALTVRERTDLEDEVTAGPEVEDVPGASVGLEPGETWTVEELLAALLVRSGNEVAEALAVHVAGDADGFLELMETDAAALGIADLDLESVSGLDDANRLSASELATIARAALADADLRALLAAERVELPDLGPVPNRNLLIGSYRGATGVKTGFTDGAGNSLIASAARGGRELVAVVLGAGEDPERFEAAAQLLDLGFEAFQPVEVAADLRFAVGGGSVGLVVEPTPLSVPDGERAELAFDLPIRPPEDDLAVAVQVGGDPYGSLTATLDGATAPPPVDGGARLGRAAVDGTYAALRAATAAGALR
jgi:serine-type D-Ala-D-Ala carboxypeptidase (penicillin-binding protein 5/6)